MVGNAQRAIILGETRYALLLRQRNTVTFSIPIPTYSTCEASFLLSWFHLVTRGQTIRRLCGHTLEKKYGESRFQMEFTSTGIRIWTISLFSFYSLDTRGVVWIKAVSAVKNDPVFDTINIPNGEF